MSLRKIYFIGCWVLFFCCFSHYAWSFEDQQEENQEKKEQVQKKRKVVVYEAIREEVHRYMGYEKLMPKYLSLPYDLTMNTNEQGTFIDIGYLLLLFLPLVLLIGIKQNGLRVLIILSSILLYIISSTTGYAAYKNVSINEVGDTISKELSELHFSEYPLLYTKVKLMQVINWVYQPIDSFFELVSGEGDYLTYPLLLLLFLLLTYLIKDRLFNNEKKDAALVYLMFSYGFWGLILSAGIIWYSILILPLGLLLIVIGCLKVSHSLDKQKVWLKRLFYITSFFWVSMALVARLGDYRALDKEQAKSAILATSLMYGLGKADEKKIIDVLYPNFNIALAKINSDPDARVYRIGTFMHYFIAQNQKRVFGDNQLGYFDLLYKRFPDKKELAAALKRSGFKYLVLDLNVATIDNTPGQSLKAKAQKFSEFISANPNIQLITTDRVMETNGKNSYTIYGQKIVNMGRFAAFEIR